MQILYGIITQLIDVTAVCYQKLRYGNLIFIPAGDHTRARFFTDPIFNVIKSIFIRFDNGSMSEYDDTLYIKINIDTQVIETINMKDSILKLEQLHNHLTLHHGSFYEEFPEQKMSVNFLKGDERVLEIGGNIGRNTLIIAALLNNSANLVSLECDPVSVDKLRENRDINGLSFYIEPSALSLRPLIQKGWDTIVSDVLLEGYTPVQTITWSALTAKYSLAFDTLVLDCEGAFYYILIDMPEVLSGIKLILMENDYHDITHKQYVDDVLTNNGFVVDYVEAGRWGPCYDRFFEVWKRSPIL